MKNKAEKLQLKLLLIDRHNDKAKDIVKLQHEAILKSFKEVAEAQRVLDDKNMNTGFRHAYKFPLVTDN